MPSPQDANQPLPGAREGDVGLQHAVNEPTQAALSSPGAEPMGQEASARKPLAIVALGASAGGLEAFRAFLDALPAHTGLAFVMIQHLAPDSASLLPDLLARHTAMPVYAVEDGMPLEADHLYVMPPRACLGLHAGKLQLESIPEKVSVQLPIDHFFESLAADQGSRAVGIVLSGTGRDGTHGLKVIKERGGMVLAQDNTTASQNGMPSSAIRTGQVDYILPVEKMPEILVRYARALAAGNKLPPEASEGAVEAILMLLRARTGNDFRGYKKGTLMRRIQRRMGLRGIEEYSAYLDVLHSEPDELQSLAKDLMIGVTRFFRDAEAYAFLAEKVVPRLIQEAPPNATLRIWTAGCSSGEEPYSLAILLTEQIARMQKALDFKIMASDIDREALDLARRGEYPQDIEVDVSSERLQRFFVQKDASYQVKRELREKIVFAEQNLISDPPFSNLDLIVCRNLLIYLDPSVQDKVIDLFHYVLKDRGYLWLGCSEGVGEHPGQFKPLSQPLRIYQRTGQRRGGLPNVPIIAGEGHAPLGRKQQAGKRPVVNVAERVNQQLLARYAPAAVLIGSGYEVLYLHGPTGRYLDPPSGMAPFDLMAMCPAGLRHQVQMAVSRARREMRCEVALGGQVERDGTVNVVKVSAEPLDVADQPGALLIRFEDEPAAVAQEPPAELTEAERGLVMRLERELKVTKEDLHDTIEALEFSNRELKAANEETNSLNEEMQSANEELQSTNEELETSREELQSLNEELTSVNNQLNEKLEELEGTNNDLVNLLAATDIATIFLDLSLHIRRFNPVTRDLLNLLPTDQGRPIEDFARKFSDESLLTDSQLVLDRLQPIEKEIQSAEGRWYLRRIIPYRTTSHQIAGVVMTFTEISRLKAIEAALREAHDQLQQRNILVERQVVDRTTALGSTTQELKTRSEELATQRELFETIVDHAPVGIAYYDRDLTIRWANPVLAQMLGSPIERVIRSKVSEAFARLGEPILEQLKHVLDRGDPLTEQAVSLSHQPDGQGGPLYLDMMYVPVRDPRGQVVGVVGMFLDVSERIAQERMQQAQIEKLREVDRLKTDFLNAASHELRTPLSSITGYAEFLEDRLGGPLTDVQSQYVSEIQKGGLRLQHLVDDLLDFARLEAGTFTLACKETDLAQLLELEVASLRPQAEEGHLSLCLDVPEGPAPIVIDAQRIGQVILNLVGNALKFTPPGGRIDVSLSRQPGEMRVEVRDNGPGIAAEHLPHLFERFFQVDPSLTRAHGGTGLGLAISKSLVEAHGGTIGVQSEPHHGSTFWFALPIQQENAVT